MSLQYRTFRICLFVSLLLLFIPSLSSAQGTLIGPVDPPPLGYTLTQTGGTDGIGKAGGITWNISNVALVTDDVVYWGPMDHEIKMSMDDNSYTEAEVMDYRSDLSSPASGVIIFTGSTLLYDKTSLTLRTVNTRCVFTITAADGTPLPLIEATVLGLPVNVGAVGSLRDWGITATGSFKVNIKLEASYNTSSYGPAFPFFDTNHYYSTAKVFSSVDGGFYFYNQLPELVNNQTINMQPGQTVVIPQTALKAEDVESQDNQILYTVGPAPGGQAPVNGVLSLNGAPLSLGDTFTQTSINLNQLSYAHNGGSGNTDSFTFTITDAQGESVPVSPAPPYSFNIEIGTVNHPPSVVDGSGTATAGTPFFSKFQATDPDLPAQPLTFSLVSNGNKGTAVLLNANDGSFRYDMQDDAFGKDTLHFQVSDGEFLSANPGMFVINLINNHAPVINGVADVVLIENETDTLFITTTDPDGNQVNLTANNLPSFAAFSTPGDGTGSIVITPHSGDAGDYPGAEVAAEDDGVPVRSTSRLFTITVNPEIKPVIRTIPETEFDFDTVYVGSGSSTVLTVYNDGNTQLHIGAMYLTGVDSDQFEIEDPGNPTEIQADDSAKYVLHFTPVSIGVKQTILVIESDDPVKNRIEIGLMGIAVHPPSDVLYRLTDLKAPPSVVIEYPVSIDISGDKNVCAFDFNLIFNKDVLSYQAWSTGWIIPSGGYFISVSLLNDSTLHVSGFNKYGDPISHSGELARISFLVDAGAPLGPVDLRITQPSAGNCQGLDLVANSWDTGHVIVDIYARLSGTISHFDPLASGTGRPLAKVPILLTDKNGNMVDQTITDEYGDYQIDSVMTLQDYILVPKLVDDETNLRRTVNSTDAYRAFSAATGSIPFPNPFQYEVGDANNSHSFNTTDAFVIFQLASYQIPNLRSYGLDDWNFVPLKALHLAKWGSGYPHAIELNNLLRDTGGLDFMGGINGDVNGTGDNLPNFPKTQSATVEFQIASAQVSTGGELSVPVNIETNGGEICAFQFQIEYDAAQMEYAGYLPGSMTPAPENWMSYFADTPEHRISAAAFVMNVENAIKGSGVLMYLNFRLKGDATEPGVSALKFNGSPVAGGPDGYDLPVIWKDGSLSIDNTVIPEQMVLQQNYPNPFNPSTTIEFILPQQTRVSLVVFNTVGEEVSHLVSEELSAGMHRYSWNAAGFPTGVYYYRLRTAEKVLTKKMLLLR